MTEAAPINGTGLRGCTWPLEVQAVKSCRLMKFDENPVGSNGCKICTNRNPVTPV